MILYPFRDEEKHSFGLFLFSSNKKSLIFRMFLRHALKQEMNNVCYPLDLVGYHA